MPLTLDFLSGEVHGAPLTTTEVRLGQLNDVFLDAASWHGMDPEVLVYRTRVFQAVPADTDGGLLWGATTIQPGVVGDEYFMTRGHFHARRSRGEFYLTLRGEGQLLLMSADRKMRTEEMRPGTLHYIPGETAHRAANTGDQELVFSACWPSDAGHDYESIARHGFSSRLRCVMGEPTLVRESPQ